VRPAKSGLSRSLRSAVCALFKWAAHSHASRSHTHTLLCARGLAGGLGFRYLENAIGSSRPINAGDNKSANYSHQFPFPFNDRLTCKFNGPAAGLTRRKNPLVCARRSSNTHTAFFSSKMFRVLQRQRAQ
jgi:hypothetical protein